MFRVDQKHHQKGWRRPLDELQTVLDNQVSQCTLHLPEDRSFLLHMRTFSDFVITLCSLLYSKLIARKVGWIPHTNLDDPNRITVAYTYAHSSLTLKISILCGV